MQTKLLPRWKKITLTILLSVINALMFFMIGQVILNIPTYLYAELGARIALIGGTFLAYVLMYNTLDIAKALFANQTEEQISKADTQEDKAISGVIKPQQQARYEQNY